MRFITQLGLIAVAWLVGIGDGRDNDGYDADGYDYGLRRARRDPFDSIRFAAHAGVNRPFYQFNLGLFFCTSLLISSSTFGAAFTHGDEYDVNPVNTKPGFDYKTPPESLCNLNKEIISFTCELVNNKTVSVCASRNLAPGTGYIVYRYGLPGKIELVYPKKLVAPREFFFYSNIWAQLGGQTTLSFFNRPYRYTVFNDWFVKGKNTVYRAGISVRNEKEIVFQKMCQGNLYYTTSRFYSGNPPAIRSESWGTDFVFDYPSGLNLPQDEFVDEIVANENSK